MPQTHSATKALRASARRRVLNDRWRRKVRDSLKAVREALVGANQEEIITAITKAESTLDRAARHNVIHWREAARRKSRLRTK